MASLKLLIFTCLLGLTLVRSQQTKYSPGFAYYYDYDGYLLHGIPNLSNHYSGFRLRADVCFNYVGDEGTNMRFTMTLKNPKLHQINGDVSPAFPDQPNASPSDIKESKGLCTKVKDSDMLLKKPVEFLWSKTSHVKSVTPSDGDKIWSLNLKKAVLSMVCGSYASIPRNKTSGVGSTTWSQEESVSGKCPTGYTYESKGNNTFEVIQIRDLTQCEKRPRDRFSNFRYRRCKNVFDSKAPKELNRIQALTQTRVLVRRQTNDDFFLTGMFTKSQYGYKPPGESKQFMTSFGNQMLTYRKCKKEPAPTIKKGKKQGLTMSLDYWPKKAMEDAVFNADADDFMNRMAKNMKTVNFTKDLVVLSDFMMDLSKDQLKSLLKKADAKKIRPAVESALATIGTKASQALMLDLLKDKSVSDISAMKLVLMASVTAARPKKLLDAFEKVAQDPIMNTKSRALTLKSLFVGMGSIYCRLRMGNKDTSQLASRAAAFIRAQGKVKHKFLKGETKELTMLMAVGNAGLTGLKDIILPRLGPSNSLAIRLQAIRAWRKLAPQLPNLTRKVFYNLFANTQEDNEIRIESYRIMARSQPSRYHMAILVQQLLREPVEQVRSYVLSHLKILASGTRPTLCNAAMIMNAQWALTALPRNLLTPKPFQSRYFTIPLKNTRWMSLTGSIIYTKDQALPRCITIGVSGAIVRASTSMWSMEIRNFGSQQRLRKLLGPYSSLLKSLQMASGKKYGGQKGKDEQADRVFFRTTVFGEDMVMIDSAAKDMLKMLGYAVAQQTSYVFQDDEEIPTSFGASVRLDQSVAGTREFQSSLKGSKKKGSKVLETTINPSVTSMMEITLGSIVGDAECYIALDAYMAVMPGGKSSFIITSRSKGKGVGLDLHLKPMGVKHRLFESEVRVFHMCFKDAKSDAVETDLVLFNPKKKIVRPMGKIGLPVEVTSMGYTTKMKAFRQPRNRRFGRGNDLSVPGMFNVALKKSKICGISLDFSSTKVDKSVEDLPDMTFADNVEPEGAEEEGDEEMYEEIVDDTELDGLDDLGPGDDAKMPTGPQTVTLKEVPDRTPEEGASSPYVTYNINIPSRLRNRKFVVGIATFGMGGRKKVGTLAFSVRNNTADKSVSMKMKMKSKSMDLSVQGSMRTLGADVYYDSSNPFKITKNVKNVWTFRVANAGKTLFDVVMRKWMSEQWIQDWKDLLENPDRLARDWPQVYRCNKDLKAGFKNTVNCVKAWEALQDLNEGSYEISHHPMMSEMAKRIVGMAKPYYSFYTKSIGDEKCSFSASYCPKDVRVVSKRQQAYKMLQGWPIVMTCDISTEQKDGKIYTSGVTFDGMPFSASSKVDLVNGKSVVLAQDRRKNQFTVATNYSKEGKPETHVHYKIMGKWCHLIVTMKDGKPTINKQAKCELLNSKKQLVQTFTSAPDVYFSANAITIRVPSRRLVVHTTPGKYNRIHIGKRYHDSVRGICGNMDGETYADEMRGKSCKRQIFSSADDFVKDYIVDAPLRLDICK